MQTSVPELGEYGDALEADRYASAVLRWSGPIIVFGWVIAGLALVVLVFSLIQVLVAFGRDDMSGSGVGYAFGGVAIAAVVSLFVLLQASVILVFGYYLRMRAHWTRFQVGSALNDDAE